MMFTSRIFIKNLFAGVYITCNVMLLSNAHLGSNCTSAIAVKKFKPLLSLLCFCPPDSNALNVSLHC